MNLQTKIVLITSVTLLPSFVSADTLAGAEPLDDLQREACSHIIVMNPLGDPKYPKVSKSRGKLKVVLDDFRRNEDPKKDEYQAYVNNIRDQIVASGNNKVLFFIHGGMNINSDAAGRAVRLLSKEKSLTKDYYPVFICWDSPPYGDWEQALWVRAGKTERFGKGQIYSWATAPFQILADCGRAATRLPLVLATSAYSDFYSIRPSGFTEHVWMLKEKKAYQEELRLDQRIFTELRQDSRRWSHKAARNVSLVATLPLKVITHPVIDAIGVGAWNNMLRHTDTMFERVPRYNTKDQPTPVQTLKDDPTGALAIFLQALNGSPQVCAKKITLVGHSMGAIISNRIVAQYAKLNFENIVYLAAACRVADFEQAVIPYMANHPETKFYNLSLNPVCEAGEMFAIGKLPMDVVPRGSLLVWIDNIFGNPPSEQRRMLGVYQTALLASHNIPVPMRNRVFYKAFAAVPPNEKYDEQGRIKEPQKHGEFSDAPFWDATFWSVDSSSANKVQKQNRQGTKRPLRAGLTQN